MIKEPAVWRAAKEPAASRRVAVSGIYRPRRLAQRLVDTGFHFLYKLGDSMATALATKFYIDLGFSLTQIGLISKTTSLWASLVGGLVGGIWMVQIGINRALWIFGVVQAVTILGFAWLAQVGPDPVVLAIVIGGEAFGVGVGTAAFVAFIARTTDPRYTATQYALFTSLAAVPRTFVNSSVGYTWRKPAGSISLFCASYWRCREC